MKIDPAAVLGAAARSVETIERDGRPAKVVVVRRTYPTSVDDLWDALTTVERIPRWFSPVSGDLRVGGRYRIEGNASGEVLACDPPRRFEITWEFGGDTSWVVVSLRGTSGGDEVTLELRHIAHPPEEFWDQYGPGAVGVGWDLALLGLGLHLETGAPVDPAEFEAWSLSPEGKRVTVAVSAQWGEAAIADGEDPEVARRRATTTAAFYTGEPAGPDAGT